MLSPSTPICEVLGSLSLIFSTGLLGGFVSGFLGIGCGIIITPMLMELGIPPLVAMATQLCNAIGINLTNFLAYKRSRDVDFHLALYMLFGGILGGVTELVLLKKIHNPKMVVGKFICIYILILTILGTVMLFQSMKEHKAKGFKKHTKNVLMKRWMLHLPFHKIFVRSRAEMSILIPILIGFLAGLVSAAIGGGVNLLMAPAIIYLIGRVSPVVYGTTAIVGCAITTVIVIIYSANNYCCNIFFVVLLFTGSACGSIFGIRLSYALHRCYTYFISAIVVFLMAIRQVFKLINGASIDVIETHSQISEIFNTSPESPVIYTLVCISIITIIALFYEKILQKVYKKGFNILQQKRRKV
ncbi:MAG: sulfite exporter TauE/SafE family protein [Holosporales bacterium]|nr:sulfite exporter TauE/SafE family protein [Holosporales bacterium]